jgi:hypothetical protein
MAESYSMYMVTVMKAVVEISQFVRSAWAKQIGPIHGDVQSGNEMEREDECARE